MERLNEKRSNKTKLNEKMSNVIILKMVKKEHVKEEKAV